MATGEMPLEIGPQRRSPKLGKLSDAWVALVQSDIRTFFATADSKTRSHSKARAKQPAAIISAAARAEYESTNESNELEGTSPRSDHNRKLTLGYLCGSRRCQLPRRSHG